MELFNRMVRDDYEHISFFHDETTGLKSIISIHDTTLGPALGGTRFYPYASDQAALDDVLNLSRGMTYKASLAGLDLGGGKAVIIGDPKTTKSKELLLAYGSCVERLGGKYITSVDSGTEAKDMDILHEVTNHVVGSTKRTGGSEDPSPNTALGVYHGIRATCQFVYGSSDVAEKTIAIQGVGNVGTTLARLLHKDGARIVLADQRKDHAQKLAIELGVELVDPASIHAQECDIFSPCAMGGSINPKTIPDLKCKIIAGAANNQLANAEMATQLQSLNILYAPDYAINSGGLISVASETAGFSREEVLQRTARIYDTMLRIFERAKSDKQTTAFVADKLAEERLKIAKQR